MIITYEPTALEKEQEQRKYCTSCGHVLETSRWLSHYNKTTGEPEFGTTLFCPVFLGAIRGHTVLKYYPNGDEIMEYPPF